MYTTGIRLHSGFIEGKKLSEKGGVYKTRRTRALRVKCRYNRTRYRLRIRDWSTPQLLIGRLVDCAWACKYSSLAAWPLRRRTRVSAVASAQMDKAVKHDADRVRVIVVFTHDCDGLCPADNHKTSET